MNMYFYENCRLFLEKLILEKSDNIELVKVYSRLIEKVAEVEIAYRANDVDYYKNQDKSNADVAKNLHSVQGEVYKKSLDKGIQGYTPIPGQV